MATVEELSTALGDLKTALGAKLAAINAEFAKLEKEIAEGGITPASLEPLKEAVASLKADIEGEAVPTE